MFVYPSVMQQWLIYTESQKKLITSSGRRPLKSTLSKLIIFGQKLALILLNKNIWKTHHFSRIKKEKNAVKSQKVIFRKSQKLLTERALSELWASSTDAAYSKHSAIHSISKAGWIARKRRTGYCLLRTPSPRGKQFLWFLKIDLLRFHRIYLLFHCSKV